MNDRRKHKRIPFTMTLEIQDLFRQDYEVIRGLNEAISIENISKSGLGFLCQHELPVGYYFNTKIVFDEKMYFYCVIKILRKIPQEQGYYYGCEFIGLAEFLANIIDKYEREVETKDTEDDE